jgi:hypothetical protein
MARIEKVSYNNHLHMVGVGSHGQDGEDIYAGHGCQGML